MTEKELKKKKIGFVSLGCDKNRVDLEKMIARLKNYGFVVTPDASDAEIILINTCAFIEPSRVESINTILEMANLKSDKLERLIVTGCLPEYKFEEVKNAIPEIDLLLHISSNQDIVKEIAKSYDVELSAEVKPNYDKARVLTTSGHYAYLKISDGCNNFCSYCTIPYIRGRYKSEKMEDLIDEAKDLVAGGVTEIILVAQDVTKYGTDLYGESKLTDLLKELSKIKKLKWIRLLYCYPELIDDKLIAEIKNNDKVVKYIDMPLQHINNNILKAMNRKNTKEQAEALIDKLRKEIPDIVIRTTFIIGLPYESRKAYKELYDFVETKKLNHTGFFSYSREEGTRAASFKHQVPEFIKKRRLNKIAKLQKFICYDNNEKLTGKVFDVVIDSIEDGMAIGRTSFQAPDIDNNVIIKNDNLEIGKYYKVKIVEVLDNFYDLMGEIYEDELAK